jgi:hypothetical protein
MKSGTSRRRLLILPATGIFCVILSATFCIFGDIMSAQDSALPGATPAQSAAAEKAAVPGTEERIEQIERMLQSMQPTIKRGDERSYDNKLMSKDLIMYVKVIAVILGCIAVGFPLTVWLMSRKRILGLSGLSDEVSSTLVLVEERQAKLANILREIQSEIDYLHTMSAPDLKNLIQQAENYLKQNETDLQKTGGKRKPESPKK